MNRIFTFLLIFCCSGWLHAQVISDFDDITLDQDTFLNGMDGAGGFTSGDAFYPNFYNPMFGGFWQSGWALSNVQDSVDFTFLNLYGAKPNAGFNSENYAVGQQNAMIQLTGSAMGQIVNGIYVTNSTFAHGVILAGNDFSKVFGGTTGDDPDFFKLTIRKYLNGNLAEEEVDFYLADYRFEDNSMDYVVDTWEFVDLSSLGEVDSLLFTMSSTDADSNGINTPLFFCVDELSLFNPVSTSNLTNKTLSIHPNPANEVVYLNGTATTGDLRIFSTQGQLMYQQTTSGNVKVEVNHWPQGHYFVHWRKAGLVETGRFIR